MVNPNGEPTPPDDLLDALIQRLDALELPELRSLLSYTEQRIDASRTPIEEEIEAKAAGEILAIEKHSAYAIVRKHPPDPDGDSETSTIAHRPVVKPAGEGSTKMSIPAHIVAATTSITLIQTSNLCQVH